jgi:hypothetical protein
MPLSRDPPEYGKEPRTTTIVSCRNGSSRKRSLFDAEVLSAANVASSALVTEIRRGCHDHAQHHPSAGASMGRAN